MQTTVYVDVLLVLNYIVTMLLVVCMAKLLGITTKRRKIVAAALLGSVSSLTIFLPFMGFFASIASKLLLSAAIVFAALPNYGLRQFLKGWFVFFAVSFFFAGVMLGVWMAFAPRGMVYYNGVVYFDVSALTLLVTTVAAYLLLSLASRLGRSGRLQGGECSAMLYLGGKVCALRALVDTGNSLQEPFSGIPVIVCTAQAVEPLLGEAGVQALLDGRLDEVAESANVRMIPFSSVGGGGAMPAFRADQLVCERAGGLTRTDRVYVALSRERVGNGRYNAILNPDLVAVEERREAAHRG